jgi:hypothetical protein
MLKLCKVGLVCSFFSLVLGCGPSAPSEPSKEKVDELNAQMDADMKQMMKQVPKTPGK